MTDLQNPPEDTTRSRVDFLDVGIKLGQGHPFINDFELEPNGDRLSADGGNQDTDGHTVIDLPS